MMWERLLPRLYTDVDFKTNKQCKLLSVLAKQPGVVSAYPKTYSVCFSGSQKISFVVKCASLEWLAVASANVTDAGGPRHGSTTEKDGRKEPSFMAFLRSHPQLRRLKLQHVVGDTFPSALNLHPQALPSLYTFSGPLTYIRTLPQPWLLENLALNGLQHSASSFPRLFSTLQQLTSLQSLSLLIDLSLYTTVNRSLQPRDHSKIFHSLLASCPRLSHLDLLCFTQPTFNVMEFSNAIQSAPHLRSFILTKVHASSDEDMTHTAAQLARQNPALETFTLRFSQDSWLNPAGIRPKHVGTYVVLRDAAGVPTSLAAHEWGVKSFGYNYARRFQHKIPVAQVQRRPSLMRLGRSRSPVVALVREQPLELHTVVLLLRVVAQNRPYPYFYSAMPGVRGIRNRIWDENLFREGSVESPDHPRSNAAEPLTSKEARPRFGWSIAQHLVVIGLILLGLKGLVTSITYCIEGRETALGVSIETPNEDSKPMLKAREIDIRGDVNGSKPPARPTQGSTGIHRQDLGEKDVVAAGVWGSDMIVSDRNENLLPDEP
ncbi:hypothetical protein B0H11DRAFT_2319439 [Mycena galericulata]|nr:hypothetical protein B0H11DRAFT_2319439 [Mycena galericulata]